MTLMDPSRSLANLIYLGYNSDPALALRLTRRRLLDRKKKQTERNVFKCLVFGPKKAGKTALLKSFIGRYILETQCKFIQINCLYLLDTMIYKSLLLFATFFTEQ